MEITRRSFLKSIATLAAYFVVPVEITKTIDYLISQPEQPITKSTPSGFMKIDGKIFPIVSMDAVRHSSIPQLLFALDKNKYNVIGSIKDDYQEWHIDTRYYYSKPLRNYIEHLYKSGHRVDFEINPYNSNIVVKGRGSIMNWFIEAYTDYFITNENSISPPIYGFKIITTEDIIFS